jgi:hypothetical protein
MWPKQTSVQPAPSTAQQAKARQNNSKPAPILALALAVEPEGAGGNGPIRRERRQGHSSGPVRPTSDTEHFGDQIGKREDSSFLIGFKNIGGFPVAATTGQTKDQQIRQFIIENELDSAGLIETDVKWNECAMRDRLEQRTRGWFEGLSIQKAYYRKNPNRSKHQYGGTSVWSINSFSHRIKKQGEDASGLGRWSWVCYQGRGNTHLRVVSGYRPNANKGPTTVWSQHKAWLTEKDDDREPRQAFIEDLCTEVEKWIAAGDQIVLGLDANESLTLTDKVTTAFRRVGLINAITARHGRNTPRTHQSGSETIDGLFVTEDLLGQRCGYLPFGDFDHRGMWIELPYQVALGHTLPQVVRPAMRKLKLKDPRTVKKYVKRLRKAIRDNMMLERARELYEEIADAWSYGVFELSPNQAQRFDQLEIERVEAMKEAERLCRKLFLGAIPWSPALGQAYAAAYYWRKSLHKKQGRRIHTRFLQRLRKRAGDFQHVPGLTEQQIKERLQQAYDHLAEVKRKASEHRQTYQEGLIQAYEQDGHPNAAKKVEQLMKREQIRIDNAAIRAAQGKTNKGSVSFVLERDEHGELQERRTKEEIEAACLRENDRRFRLASNTPMLQDPLIGDFGPTGTTREAEEVLAGTYVPKEGTDPYFTAMLPYLQRPQAIRDDPIDLTLDVEARRTSWRRAKEETSSSPSGLHYGHYKCGARDAEIGELHAILGNLSLRSGHIPERWKRTVDCILGKGKGNEVTNLRTICLFEADANNEFGEIGRKCMEKAEKHNTLPREQYGGRKGHSAQDQALNKMLFDDKLRLMRQPGAKMVGDLAKCYDRIEHSFAGLALQSQGLEPGPVNMMFGTIQQLKHHVRTIYGDSEMSFTSDNPLYVVPIQGIGQGNKAGPPIFTFVSSPCLKLLYDRGYRCFFKCAISGEEVSIVGFGFVDDYDQVTTGEKPTAPASEAVDKMQDAVVDWAGGIWITGGQLEPTKSHWSLVDFAWRHGIASYKSIAQAPAEIKYTDENGVTVTLERLEPWEARRSLGVYQAPDGNMNEQYRVMLGQSEKWASNTRHSRLPRHLVWQSLKVSICMTLKYPLPATTLSKEQCEDIMKPILSAGLSHSGIVNTVKRAVAYGPERFLGLGLPHLHVEQTIEGVQRILRFVKSKAVPGQFIRSTIQDHTVELGLPGNMFQHSFKEFGHLATQSKMKSMWESLERYEMKLEIKMDSLSLLAERDEFLMQAFFDAGYRGSILEELNRCRKFLHAVTLGDIATADGTSFSRDAWEGVGSDRRPRIVWPNQGELPESAWKNWREALKVTFGKTRGILLRQRLGPWYKASDPDWIYWYDRATERVYEKRNGAWGFYPRPPIRGGRTSISKYRLEDWQAEELPPGVVRATCNKLRRARSNHSLYLVLQAVDDRQYEPTEQGEQQVPSTIGERINQLPESARWAVANATLTQGDYATLAQDIKNGDAIAVSDGSFKDQLGTAAWTIEGRDASPTTKTSVEGSCVIPGNPEDQGAYRSELGGLYCITVATNLVCQHEAITSGKMTIACDGDSALWMAVDQEAEIGPATQQFDIICAIREQIQQSPIEWKTRRVAGHQDNKPYNVLDRFETLNCRMDSMAKDHWKRHQMSANYTGEISGAPGALRIDGTAVHTNFKQAIYNHTQGRELLNYWDQKGRFGNSKEDGGTKEVDWEVVEALTASLPRARQHWLVKQVARVSATGKNMVRRGEQRSAACPRCTHEEEDNDHVLLCQHSTVKVVWTEQMDQLSEYMKKQGTSPSIRKAILSGLWAWYRSEPYTLPEEVTSQAVVAAFKQQTAIGWRALLEGCPGTLWAIAQQTIFQSSRRNNHRTGRSWMRAITRRLVEFAFTLWEHRNEAAQKKETSVIEKEVNQQIDSEFGKGFRGIRNLGFTTKPAEQLKKAPLATRKAWLRNVRIQRAALKRKAARNQIPDWVLASIGIVNWYRFGKPPVPTPLILAQYPNLNQATTTTTTATTTTTSTTTD